MAEAVDPSAVVVVRVSAMLVVVRVSAKPAVVLEYSSVVVDPLAQPLVAPWQEAVPLP